MLSQKEVLNLPDLLNAHAAAIERGAVEQEQCQDEQLRQILQRHAQVFRQHHQALTSVLQRYGGDHGGRGPGANAVGPVGQGGIGGYSPQGIGQGDRLANFNQFEPYQPQINQRRLSDRTIAQGCLDCNKHLAMTCTIMALEAATPEIRRLLMDMARDHVEMAYELFSYLEQHRWYVVPPAQQPMVSQMMQGYPQVGGGGPAGQPNPAPIGAPTY
ncbi:MAG TPA: spore coat protein [Bacillota bacterium]